MKKILHLSLFLALCGFSAHAQDGDLKPLIGARNLEVQINPFVSNPLQLTSSGFLSGLKARKFTAANRALRLVGNLSYARTSEVIRDAGTGSNTDPELNAVRSSFNIGVRPGIEKHFAGTKHISPYFGAEVGLGLTTTSETREQEGDSNNSVEETKFQNEGGGFNFALGAVAGLDIYVAKHMYIGTEVGFGLSSFVPFATEVTPPQGDSFKTKEDKITSINIGPSIQSAIRFGFIF